VDHQHHIKSQIKESKSHKQFTSTTNRNIYLELTSLEEQQIVLDKLLNEEKKAAKRNVIQKTISETKIKIAQKKEDIKYEKEIEKLEQVEVNQKIQVEAVKLKEEVVRKKMDMKRAMSKQFEEIAKKKEDAYELDNLAQTEADRRNIIFDQTQVKKQILKRDLIKQAVMGNDDQLVQKDWKKNMEKREGKQDKIYSTDQAIIAKSETQQEKIEDKKVRQNMHVALKLQMKKQEEEAETVAKNGLSLEKKILQKANQFDSYVDDIVHAKRAYLDKLRSQRPF